jgi:hypothetical protein
MVKPTTEYLRKKAKQIDAKEQSAPPRKLSSVEAKTLDKEFWEAM